MVATFFCGSMTLKMRVAVELEEAGNRLDLAGEGEMKVAGNESVEIVISTVSRLFLILRVPLQLSAL